VKVTEKSAAEGIAAPGENSLTHKGKIKRLPPDLRAEFDRRLVAGAFSDYRGLSRWLRENGYSINHTSLARYGRALDRKLEALKLATEQARAVVEAAGAADDSINEGLMRLVQGDLFRVLVELKETDTDKVDVNALARNVASICRSSVVMRRAAEEMRNGIGRRVLAAERKVVAAARKGSHGGLSAAAEKRIRAALLEIAEMPVMAAGDEASLAAHRLVGGVERSSADEPAPSAPMKKALSERESVGEGSGGACDD
jgi:Protein of unknown function (DUF3486)